MTTRPEIIGGEALQHLLYEHPAGIFLAVIDRDDFHSLQQLHNYDEFLSLLDDSDAIPLYLLDAKKEQNWDMLKPLLVFSTPTFLWLMNHYDEALSPQILLRLVGTVPARKIQVELEKVLDGS